MASSQYIGSCKQRRAGNAVSHFRSVPVQVLQGALSRQYTGASTVSEMSLKIRLERYFKEKSTSDIDWRVMFVSKNTENLITCKNYNSHLL